MSPRSIRMPLLAMQVATVATLMRSVALDRWITVAACLVLLAASAAGSRGRTWGVALAFPLGVTFLGICALGIAPPWFALLGLLAIRPFMRMWRHFFAFDRGATVLLTSAATALGAAGAVAWKTYAHALFQAVPALVPSIYPHHGVLVLAIGALASVAGLLQGRAEERADAAQPAAARVRIADPVAEPSYEELEEAEVEHETPAKMSR
ncbi:MAG: hypothetical protein U0270_20555 [Labilithrix sp.]